MKTYEVTVKRPAHYGREGSGDRGVYKVQAAGRRSAVGRAIFDFYKDHGPKDYPGRTLTIEIVRVL